MLSEFPSLCPSIHVTGLTRGSVALGSMGTSTHAAYPPETRASLGGEAEGSHQLLPDSNSGAHVEVEGKDQFHRAVF